MHVKKHPPPSPLDLKQEKVNLFRPKKGHFAENFSFAFDIFEACLIFERPNISRSPKATSWRTLQMKIPATISDPSEQILIATKNRIPRWPSSLNFQKQGQTKFHTLCAWDYKRICYHTQKKRVSCQASCFQNPPILLQLNDNWKKSSWAYISLYHHFHPHQTLHEQIFLQRKITSPLPCKDNPPILRAPKYTPPHDDIWISNYIYLPTTMIWIIQKQTAVQLFYALRSKPDSVELSVWLQGFVQPCPLKLPMGWRV